MGVKKEDVLKALDSLEAQLGDEGENVNKASEQGLEQPEGADLGNPAKEKMSDAAKAKAKKAMKAADEAEDMDDEEEEEEGEEKEEKGMKKKSFAEELPEEVQTKIDVSEFLKSLVEHTGESIDGLREHVAKSDLAHEARYTELAETLSDVQKSQAKIGVILKAVCERIGVIEAAPARPAKADTVAKGSGAAERQFNSGLAEEGTEKLFKSLSDNPLVAKSQIAGAMCDLVHKGEATDLDVIGFESGGYIRPEVVAKLKTVLN